MLSWAIKRTNFNKMEVTSKNNESTQLGITAVRQRAMLWWNNLDDNLNDGFSKWKLGYKYYDRHWMSLTGREIEIIYKCEHVA